jgi:hypothetical protein
MGPTVNPAQNAETVRELREIAAELEASQMLWLERIAEPLWALADRQDESEER